MSQYASIPPPNGMAGAVSVAMARAQLILGATINAAFGTDFDNDQWHASSVSGTGAVAMSATARGGVISASSGATASSTAKVFPHGSVSHIDNPLTSLWYVRSRFALTTGIDAQSTLLVGVQSPSGGFPDIGIGGLGAVSSTLFSCIIGNGSGAAIASATSSVNVDTSWHTAEVWNDGTNISFALDGSTFAILANSSATNTPMSLSALAANGTTAANRAVQVDYMILCCASN